MRENFLNWATRVLNSNKGRISHAAEKCKSVNLPRCSSPRNQIADEREIRAPMLIHGRRGGRGSCTCFVKIEKRRGKKEMLVVVGREENATFPLFPLFPTFRSFDSLSFTPSSPSSSFLFSRKRNFVCCVPSRVTRKTLVPAYQEARKATTDRSTLKNNRKKWNFSGSCMYRVCPVKCM